MLPDNRGTNSQNNQRSIRNIATSYANAKCTKGSYATQKRKTGHSPRSDCLYSGTAAAIWRARG